MLGELVHFRTEDGLELDGMFYSPKGRGRRAAISVHGFTGTFYENRDDFFAEGLTRAGWAFLTMNNRGHGHIADFTIRRNGRKSRLLAGAAFERFEDCIYDILAAKRFLKRMGYSEFVLVGHSTGCQKIVYYQLTQRDRDVKALVLLAPVDDTAWQKRYLGDRFRAALRHARELVRRGREKEWMPQWSFDGPISAGRYWRMFAPHSVEGRMFDYASGLPHLGELKLPIYAAFGDREEYAVMSPKKMLAVIKAAAGSSCETRLIRGADHGFNHRERALVRSVVAWLKNAI